MMQAKFRAGRRTGAQPARAANNTEILVSDQKYAWAAGLVMYVLLFYMAVPYFLFNPPDDNSVTFTEPNPLYRALKYLVLFCGIALVIRRRSLAALLLRQVNGFFLAFFLLVLLSVAWSIEPAITLTRFGALCTIWVACFGCALVGWHKRRFEQIILRFFTMLAVGSLIFGILWPNLAIEKGTGISLQGAWHGLLIQKNGLGHAASIAIFFWVHAWLAKETKLLHFVVGCGTSLACLILSRSSTSIFATLFAVALLILMLKGPRAKRPFMVFIVIVFAATILLYSLAVLNIVPGLDAIMQPIIAITGKDMTFSGRTQIWEIIRQHIVQRPLLGTGYGAYWIGRVPTSPSYVFITSKSNFYPTEAHNGYLDIINDLGYIGLACLLGYLLVFLRQSLALLKIDFVAATLYLALLFEELINNLSESDWLSTSSLSIVVMTLATFALARAAFDQRWQARLRESPTLERAPGGPALKRARVSRPHSAET